MNSESILQISISRRDMLLALAGAGILLQACRPQTEVSKNWTLFTPQIKDFEIYVPQSWNLEEVIETPDKRVYRFSTQPHPNPEGLQINITTPAPSKAYLAEQVTAFKKTMGMGIAEYPPPTLEEKQDVWFAGQKAWQLIYFYEPFPKWNIPPYYRNIVIFIKNNEWWSLNTKADELNKAKEVLNRFRFL